MKNNIHSHAIRRFMTLGIVVILWGTQALAQTAGSKLSEWENLRSIASTQKVSIEKKDGKKLTAKIQSAPDTELVIERKGKTEALRRDEIKRVRLVTRNVSKARAALFGGIGVGVGLLGGLMVLAALSEKQCGLSCADENAIGIGGMVGLPVLGGILGAKMAGKKKEVLVFEAP